ncbi:hypothetical protein K0M31_015719 [Melipona bicolor]|uniref:MYND-type domain-containing protein n=1 Tax=Melipona bicolor TaxID=60889 RepID=A0AA40FEY9_9HYME|nr:hypothetical protein K0M31_015719 [Melipona bicolor]
MDKVTKPRIVIADNPSKLSCNGNGSLATALRDRGPCFIPVQPNRSLPILPAPSIPTRFFRKDSPAILVQPPKSTANVESMKSIGALPNEQFQKDVDVNPGEQMSSKDAISSMNYVVPQISSVESLSTIKRRSDNDAEHNEKNNAKENRKKKKANSQETKNASQSKGKCTEGSIKEFLTNFCGSNATEGIQNLCTEKCVRAASTTKEDERSGNKLVPPLKLKKVLHTETDGYNDSQIVTRVEHESNYRIITDGASQSPFSLSTGNWDDILYEKDADFTALNTDSYKLKYRRNRLKQKLRELRGKAMDLAKEMASDLNSQESTRLRQVMNRYEKQIENLSKLHNKLSAALSISKEAVDINNDSTNPSDNNYPCVSLNKGKTDFQTNDSSPVSSPEPPKLSPRSSLDCDIILPEEVRNSPPILPLCLTISSSQDSVEEELQAAERKVWPVNEELMKPTFPTDPLAENLTDSVNKGPPDIEKHARDTPVLHVDVESSDFGANKRDFNYSKKIAQLPENNLRAARERSNEKSKSIEEFPRNQRHFMIQEPEKIKCLGFPDAESVISSATNGVEVSTTVQKNKTFEAIPAKQLPSSREQTIQSNFYRSNQKEISFANAHENSMNAQKVSSSSGQSNQFNSLRMLNQEQFTLRQNYKEEEISTDSVQRNSGNHSITEQFPTLGNWLARMSKKQSSMAKSKLHVAENVPTENITRQIPGSEKPKIIGSNINNHMINTTPQRGTEKWQYHHQQQQLQHVAASVTLSQPVAAVPPLRPGICPPLPMTQFYPNNYAIDPYNGAALNYHPAIYPYGPYPYHPRLHTGSLPLHFPTQESLRTMQHTDKRFPLLQDPIVRYPSPSTSTLQHPSNLEFDRLRGNSTTNNIGATTCLPSLFLSPPSLSTSHQALPRNPLISYPTNNQFSQNRMIPDVVAAAAAAAVVAAASFDRQRDTLTYNRSETEALSSASIPNVIDREPPHVPSATKSIINRDVTNQTQDNNFNEQSHENTKYQQMQNFLFDRLALVKTTDNFVPTNSVIGNDGRSMTSIVSAAQYRMPVISSYAQLSKNVPETEIRNCETPHLGKVNRSPNSSHNFTCSNCGIIGPKFKCLGCEMAFYCDERCQEKHWDIHVQRCPKKMPKLKKVV